ncbi:MAG: SGNH/GDSL hydrolase family protein [Clostridia bacterium]|nr:SGNH/GDSL hydrolase family protein [Clostridia bacterium]
MKLEGKKINFLGDSITEGCGTDYRFDQMIAEQTGAICRNYGIGGTRIARNVKPSLNPLFDQYYDSRVDNMDPDADVIVVFGGTNDFGHGDAQPGTMSNRTVDTFYGAMHCLITHLKDRYPTAEIVFITPLHRLNENDPDGDGGFKPYGTYAPLKRYVNIIREVCEYYSIPVLDLWKNSGLQPAIPKVQELYIPDGLHPNRAGHEIIASRLLGLLQTL